MAASPRSRRRDDGARWAPATALLALSAAALIAGCAGSRPRAEQEPPRRPPPSTPPTSSTPDPALPGRAAPVTGVPGSGPPPPPPVSDAWRRATSLRVGLKVGAAQLVVSGSREWALTQLGGGRIATSEKGVPLRIYRTSGKIEVRRQGNFRVIWTGDEEDTLLIRPVAGAFAGWNGKWYRGSFRIHATSPQGLTLVNEVGLEDYLRGVLPDEIGTPPESDYEAVKAQAVAARTYTLSYLGRRADLGFDLWATVEDQVYGGTSRENAQSNRAVEATGGELLLSGGAPIRALYSSACGGRTSNVEDVWPWPWTAYLRSTRDADGDREAYCSRSANYRWREEWGVDAFTQMLRKFVPETDPSRPILAGDLVDVRVGARSRSGRVRDLVITTTSGDYVLRGDRTRWGLRRPGGEAILRSAFFKIGVLRAADGAPLKVVATGGGNGHGIGMCQWGAMGMARAGKSYKEILRHYYKATQLTRI